MGSHSVTHSPPPTHTPDTHKPDNAHKPDKTDNSKKDKKKDDSSNADQDQLNSLIVQFAISIMQKSIQQSKEINADLKSEDSDAF